MSNGKKKHTPQSLKSLLIKHGENKYIPYYAKHKAEIDRIINEIEQENSELCCVLQIPHFDFKFWLFDVLDFVQDLSGDAAKTKGSINPVYQAQAQIAVGVCNDLRADLTMLFRDDPELASMELRLRWLETAILVSWMEIYVDTYEEEPNSTLEDYRKYLNLMQEQVDFELLDCLLTCFTVRYIEQRGDDWELPEVRKRFTPEELAFYFMEKMKEYTGPGENGLNEI